VPWLGFYALAGAAANGADDGRWNFRLRVSTFDTRNNCATEQQVRLWSCNNSIGIAGGNSRRSLVGTYGYSVGKMAVTKNFDLVFKGMGSEAAAAAFRYCAAGREVVGEDLYCGQRLQLQLLTSGINSYGRVKLRGSSRCWMIFSNLPWSTAGPRPSGDRCDLASHDSQLAHPVDQGRPGQPEAGRRASGAANHPPRRAECFKYVAALGLGQRADGGG
jgi:hypothetical protein